LQQTQAEREENLQTTVNQTRSTVEAFLKKISIEGKWEEEVIEAMHDDYKTNETMKYLRASPAIGMETNLDAEDTRRFNEGLLDWIRFAELDIRHDKISTAYEETFEWIFRDSSNSTWSSFTNWLTDDDEQLYWITGKPAAGKSTLMKFIYSDPRTKRFLRDWAKEKQLIFCAFYFWNAGTGMQLSQEGLARTLLHSALRQAPELWSLLFPYQMEEYVAYRNPWNKPVTWNVILRAFRLLVEGAGTKYKLFFLIDGLDEYGDDHEKIINMIQGFLSPNVKTCVSSRPWNIFQDSFQQRPSLKLEDITYQDIKLYVSRRFRGSRGFKDRRSETPKEADQLIENITQKASGVFLWVALVTDSLLEGLADGERLSDLQARLDSLPTDLETLFWNILNRLPAAHLARTSQLLQIFRASLVPLDLLMLSYADESDPEYALKFKLGSRTVEQSNARAQILRRRLNACCKGLIESKPTPGRPLAFAQVDYLHRTVKDYVEREDNWSRFLAMTDGPFNPYTRLCNTHLVKLKMMGRHIFGTDRGKAFWKNVTCIMHFAKRADPGCTTGLQTKLLNELDVTASYLAALKGTAGLSFLEIYAKRSVSWVPIQHWSATYQNCWLNQTFLDLAVQFQMTDYIRDVMPSLASQTKILTHALLIAVTSSDVTYLADFWTWGERPRPDPDVVTLLLNNGADPNEKISDAMLYSTRQDKVPVSCWGAYLMANSVVGELGSQIVQAFLDCGADTSLASKASRDVRRLVWKYRKDKQVKRISKYIFFLSKAKT
jgi:hypothetical protein